jgi:hypothetical protein
MQKNLISSLSSLRDTCGDRELIWWFTRQTALNLQALFKQPKDNFDHGNNAPTIVLTAGLLCNNGPMRLLWEELNENFNIAYAPQSIGLNFRDIEKASSQLWNKVASVLEEHETNLDLHLLWHSLWWLVSIEALMNTHRLKVNTVLTCATPFWWTEMANFVPFFKAARQINTSWWFLSGKWNIDNKIEKLCINVSKDDVFVLPQSQIPDTTLSSKVQILEHNWFKHTDFIIWHKVKAFSTIVCWLLDS